MADIKLEDWFPMSPLMGPPLPKWMGITWPWYKEAGPPPGGYCCPYEPADTPVCFDTYDEVVSHIQNEHPNERTPIEITWD